MENKKIITKEETLVWREMKKLGWNKKPKNFSLDYFKDIIKATKETFCSTDVVDNLIKKLKNLQVYYIEADADNHGEDADIVVTESSRGDWVRKHDLDELMKETGVTPRFSIEEIMVLAEERAKKMSTGDKEQDEQCVYNFAVGMEEMQYRLLDE